jgi:hypothetical protein
MYEEIDGRMRQLGYEPLGPGKWGMKVSASRRMSELLNSRLDWFCGMASAIGTPLEFGPENIWLGGSLYDDQVRIADELRRLHEFLQRESMPRDPGLGTIPFLLSPSFRGDPVFRNLYAEACRRAHRTQNWRELNRAWAMAGIRARVRIDPVTGKARPGLYDEPANGGGRKARWHQR